MKSMSSNTYFIFEQKAKAIGYYFGEPIWLGWGLLTFLITYQENSAFTVFGSKVTVKFTFCSLSIIIL